MITLVVPSRRFVLKYVKSDQGIPPLAPAETQPGRGEWGRDHGIVADGLLHPAIWQHIRAFESYGDLALPSRVYLSDGACRRLNMAEHRALGRFRSMGIVRSLGPRDGRARVAYPWDFTEAKRPDGGIVAVSAMIAQPYVTTLADAMSGELQRGNVGRVSDLLDSYAGFVRQLWLHGVCHLDFSILNVGLSGHRGEESFVLFDPHMGVIELSPAGPEVRDPLAARPQEQRSLAELLRAARDGSRWVLWRIEEMAASAPDIPEDQAAEAAKIVERFHLATGPVDQGNGLFSHQRYNGSGGRSQGSMSWPGHIPGSCWCIRCGPWTAGCSSSGLGAPRLPAAGSGAGHGKRSGAAPVLGLPDGVRTAPVASDSQRLGRPRAANQALGPRGHAGRAGHPG